MIAVRTGTRRLRATYRIAVGLAAGAGVWFGFDVLDVSYPWPGVLGGGAAGVVAIAMNVWITGRPHFFSSPFKQ